MIAGSPIMDGVRRNKSAIPATSIHFTFSTVLFLNRFIYEYIFFAVMNVQKNLGFVQMFTFIACLLFSLLD